MECLTQLKADNRMTNRDLGSMCNWFVFLEGDLLAGFVERADAEEFVSSYEYDHGLAANGITITLSEAKP